MLAVHVGAGGCDEVGHSAQRSRQCLTALAVSHHADFFDEASHASDAAKHYVLRGASDATHWALRRDSFRNWCGPVDASTPTELSAPCAVRQGRYVTLSGPVESPDAFA